MELNLKYIDWSNLNRNAHAVKSNSQKKNSNPNELVVDSLYCLELVGNSQKIACLGSNQLISIYDQSSLKLVTQIQTPPNSNSIGFFKQSETMLFVCADDGLLKCWDLREDGQEAICIEFKYDLDKRDFLCADVNSTDTLIVTGTNKSIDESLILIYDLRFRERHLHKFRESHSDDVTQVKFNPASAKKFSSASLDGLVCLYDLNMQPDEITPKLNGNDEKDSESSDSESETDADLMDQCLNTESCVNKIGYLSSNLNSTIDRLYAITSTNDIFIWDLNTYDAVYKKQSANKNILDFSKIDVDRELSENEEYFFDCFYYRENYMVLAKANNAGQVSLYNGDRLLFEQQSNSLEENSSDGRVHRDVIRSSYWSGKNDSLLFTAGEDGFILKWNLQKRADASSSASNVLGVEKKRRVVGELEERKIKKIPSEKDGDESDGDEEKVVVEPKRLKKKEKKLNKKLKNKKKKLLKNKKNKI